MDKWTGMALLQGKYHLVINGYVVATEGDHTRDPHLDDFWHKEDMERVIKGSCACGCSHATDNGPCPTYERGMNRRCVYCDHGPLCHNAGEGRERHNRPL